MEFFFSVSNVHLGKHSPTFFFSLSLLTYWNFIFPSILFCLFFCFFLVLVIQPPPPPSWFSICGIGNHSILESLFHFIKIIIIIIVGWFLRLSQAATRSFISYNAKYYTMVHIKPNKQTNIK